MTNGIQIQIEKVHIQLGVNRSTSTMMLRGEVGRYSPQSRIIIGNVRYLSQVKQKKDNILVKQAYIYMKEVSKQNIYCKYNNEN